jgi:outer membrane protein W
MRTFYTLPVAFLAISAYAQRYEIGMQAGLSHYTTAKVEGARSAFTAEAGFKQGLAAGVTIGHNMYERLGGEVRYTYLRNDLKLEAGGQQTAFGGDAHALHYDLLFHFTRFRSRVRPYAAFGGGLKRYRGTGQDTAFQPLAGFAILTRTSEIQPLVSAGGGLKIAITDAVSIRADVHDFLSPVPSQVIAPAPGARISGWLHNIVPTVGISFHF